MFSQIRALVGAAFASASPAAADPPKAEDATTWWAEVRSGVLVAVHRWPPGLPPPAFDPEVATAIEITHTTPRPAPGWVWSESLGFQPPPEGV